MSVLDYTIAIDKALAASIEDFLHDYGKAFASLNADAVAAYFTLPFYVELDGDPIVWGVGQEEGLLQTTDALLSYYRGQNLVKCDPLIEAILPTGKNRVSVVMNWNLCSAQGASWKLEKSYQLVRENKVWKIWACCGTETQH